MTSFVTDNQILCENCYKYFIAYETIISELDLDVPHAEISCSYEEKLNRITCPLCKKEYTYETDILFHSLSNKFAVYCSYDKMFLNVANFRTAMKICGFDNWNFRVCTYSYEAYEKIRIFNHGLSDTKINILKFQCFPQYKNMQENEEYINFESADSSALYFLHRDFTGKILSELTALRTDYDNIPDTPVNLGDWAVIDKTWTIKKLEEIK